MKNNMHSLFQNIKRRIIIKLLFPASLLLFSFVPGDGEGSLLRVIKKEIITSRPFQRININGDFSVVLTNKPAGAVTIEGNENDVNELKYKNRNNELVINASKKNKGAKLTIYLSASMLKHILINGDGNVSSTGTIQTNDLQIWLNGNVDVEINVSGKVSVDSFDGYDLVWKSPLIKT